MVTEKDVVVRSMRGKHALGNDNTCNGGQLVTMKAGGTELRVMKTRPESGCRRC